MRLLHHFREKVDLYLSDPALHGFRTNVWFCLLSLNQSSSQLVVDGCKWLWVLLAVMNSSYRTFFFFSPLELDLISVLGRQNLGLHAVYALLSEKTMAPHFSTLAWKIPWMEKPGRLQSIGSLRVGHDWATSLSLFTFMHWRRKWQPTPVFLPGESQGRGSLVGCRLRGHTESGRTEVT